MKKITIELTVHELERVIDWAESSLWLETEDVDLEERFRELLKKEEINERRDKRARARKSR